jgi:MFS family permease
MRAAQAHRPVSTRASAAAAGLLADRVGRRRLAAIAACGLAANWIVFAVMTSWWSSSVYIYASAMVETAFTSTLSVAVITLCMDLSWPRVAGSQFTAYMALSNFSTTLGYQFASKATEWWTFSGIWLVAAGIQLGVILLLLPIDPGQTRRELPFPAGVPLPRFGVVAMLTLLVFLIGMTGYVTVQKLG